jgi:hypothetical protein
MKLSRLRGKLLAALAINVFCGGVQAQSGSASIGRVVNASANSSGVGFFGVAADGQWFRSRPACGAAMPVASQWTFDLKTAGGRAMWAVVLQAYALNKPINVEGTGNCLVWGDRESVDFLRLVD